jgi:hypothetical protein
VRRVALALLLVLAVAVAAALLLTREDYTGDVGTSACWDDAWRCHDLNAYRAAHDRPPLDQAGELQREAGDWADTMAARGVLAHDSGVNEIVGRTTDWASVMVAWDRSTCRDGGTWDGPCPGHRELLLDRDWAQVGIGVATDAGGMRWYVVRFR